MVFSNPDCASESPAGKKLEVCTLEPPGVEALSDRDGVDWIDPDDVDARKIEFAREWTAAAFDTDANRASPR